MRFALAVIVAMLFSGCVTSTPLPGPGDGTSVFVHPVTGDVKHCEKPGPWTTGLVTGTAYAECKTAAEGLGFRRKGPQ